MSVSENHLIFFFSYVCKLKNNKITVLYMIKYIQKETNCFVLVSFLQKEREQYH